MGRSATQPRVENRITDSEMIHHLSMLRPQLEIVVHFVIVKRANTGRTQSESFRSQVEPMPNRSCFEVHIAITSIACDLCRPFQLTDHRKEYACITSEFLPEA